MARPRRRRWWILVAVAVAIVAIAALALPFVLDVERYRERIEVALAAATGWDVSVGELDFSVRRGMAVTAAPVTLAAPAADGSRVHIETLAVKARLLPLFKGRLEVERVVLDGADVRVVRLDEAAGWMLPLPPREASAEGEGEPSGPEVALETLEIRNGRLTLLDAASADPAGLALEKIRLVADLSSQRVEGRATPADGPGELRWAGSVPGPLEIELTDVAFSLLEPWVGDGIVTSDARLDGTVLVESPLRVTADLAGKNVTLLAGERPFDGSRLHLELAEAGDGLRLDEFRFEGDGAVVTGSGDVTPDLAIDLELAPTPLETALAASQSVLPLPLDVEGPGELALTVRLRPGPEEGDLTYETQGRLSAARFRPGEGLPLAEDVRTRFALDREGSLRIDILEGVVAGGVLAGVATMASIDPPSPLIFEGGIQEASLGGLLAGWVSGSEGRVRGPTGVEAAFGLLLDESATGARALQGRLDLRAREVELPGWDLENAIRRKIEERLSVSDLGGLLRDKLDRKLNEGQAEEAARDLLEQVFDTLEVGIDFDSWPWRLERLSMQAGGIESLGAGSFDPDAGRIDLRLVTRLDAERTNRVVGKHGELRVLLDDDGRLSLPLHVEGALVGPAIGVDLGDVLKRRLDGEDKKEAVKGLIRGLLDRGKEEDPQP